MHKIRLITALTSLVCFLLPGYKASAQEEEIQQSWESAQKQQQFSDSLVSLSEYYMKAYRCEDALSFLESAYALCQFDASKQRVEQEIRRCKTITNLIQNVIQVTPVDLHTFSLNDFYLYYPLPDKAWRTVDDSSAIYYPGTEPEVYISRSKSVEEVFPMVEGDRKYFASSTLGGIGGYDIYYSDWDEYLGDWGEPVNMGFPINSSADDFLLINTEDNKYTIFASNRNTSQDSVNVYIINRLDELAYVTVTDPQVLSQAALLTPDIDLKKVDVHSAAGTSIQEDESILAYQEASEQVRTLQEQILQCTSEAQKEYLAKELENAQARLSQYEEMFLSGTIEPQGKSSEVEQEVVGTDGVYTFTRKNRGPVIKVIYIED